MKIMKIHMRALAPLLLAALITGCAGSGHVGESWQCPIAQGTACQSVSEADPAARHTRESRETLPVPAPPKEAAGTINLRNLIVWFTELFNPDDEFEEDAATAEPLITMPEAEPPDHGARVEPVRPYTGGSANCSLDAVAGPWAGGTRPRSRVAGNGGLAATEPQHCCNRIVDLFQHRRTPVRSAADQPGTCQPRASRPTPVCGRPRRGL